MSWRCRSSRIDGLDDPLSDAPILELTAED
jgi:hypothetical protein